MEQFISIEFEYRKKAYYALVRIRGKSENTEYHVTIMNGALEQMLYGNHIFIEEGDEIVLDPNVPGKKTCELRQAVGMALCNHFNKPYYAAESKQAVK